MLSHQLGFMSSWKMLRRDKGWMKPLLVLALVSFIPILGQIVVLGYGLEWARLTAWGVDAAPKQRGVDYKKMLSTGAIAFLIALIVNVVLGGIGFLVLKFLFKSFSANVGDVFLGGLLSAVVGSFFDGGLNVVPFIVLFVVNIAIDAVVLAAQMRSTLYDGFGAAWRWDRIFQMIGRDVVGFVHVALVAAVSSTVAALLKKIVSAAAMAIYITGMSMRMSFSMMGPMTQSYALFESGIVPLLIILVVGILVLFVFQVVKVALTLVSINTMGQWFQRFEVGRWGVSSAPLPQDVPRQPHDPSEDAAHEGSSAPSSGSVSSDCGASAADGDPDTKDEEGPEVKDAGMVEAQEAPEEEEGPKTDGEDGAVGDGAAREPILPGNSPTE